MIYAAADLHLERYIWRSRKDLDGDAYAALRHMKRIILEDKTSEDKAVILAGDITDTRRVDGDTLDVLTEFIDELYEEEITVYIIQGNHDQGTKSAAEVQGAVSLHETLTEIDGRQVFGLNWMPGDKLREAIVHVPQCDLLVLHCMMEHLVHTAIGCDLMLDDIPDQVCDVFVGDVHVTNVTPLQDAGFCVSPGSLHACKIDEDHPKGFFKLPHGAHDWQFVEIPHRQIFRYIANDTTTLEETINSIPGDVSKAAYAAEFTPIVEIKHLSDMAEDVHKFVADNPDIARWFTKPISSKLLTSAELAQFQSEMDQATLESGLPLMVHPTEDKELYDMLQSCIKDKHTATIVEDKLKELGIDI